LSADKYVDELTTLRNVSFVRPVDPVRVVQEELSIAERRFGV